MLFGPASIISTVMKLLGVTLLLKIPITMVLAVVVIPMAIYPRPEFRTILLASAIMAVAGPVAFTLISLLPFGLIGLLLAIVIYWVIVSSVIDRYFDVHYDQSYAITGQIVITTILLWILAGFAMMFLMPNSG
jgi:hypothetical protein